MKKSEDHIFAFFIALSLLFWNPLTCYLIYGNGNIRSMKVVYLFYCLAFAGGLWLLWLIRTKRINENFKNVGLTVAFAGIVFAFLVAADGLAGIVAKNEVRRVAKPGGLIFPPNTKARYRTVEFDYVAEINSLGLRGSEIAVDKGSRFRILCFGDSWTFGWGVDNGHTWPSQLEKYLRGHGFPQAEVVNCGQGGQYTSVYKKHMERAVPLLKPDLVLVGVLQMDDLMQLYEQSQLAAEEDRPGAVRRLALKVSWAVTDYLKYSFKNLSLLFSRPSEAPLDVRTEWRNSVRIMMEKFDRVQRMSFNALDRSIQEMFKSGDLNPGLLQFYIGFPDILSVFNNPDHPATRLSARMMSDDFRDMKEICEKNHCKLVFVNLPSNQFTGHRVVRMASDIFDPYFEANNKVDSIYSAVADSHKLFYIELTKHFIRLPDKSAFFFKYDGHPNERGYEEIADYIGSQLIAHHMIRKE